MSKTLPTLLILTLGIALAATTQRVISSVRIGPTVVAAPAAAFVDSIGVATHWQYNDTPYGARFPELKAAILNAGLHHVRDGGASPLFIQRTQELGNAGILTTLVVSPLSGVAPSGDYWTNPPHDLLLDLIKNKIGVHSIDAIEMENEVDVNYKKIRWHPNDTASLTNDPASPSYWMRYLVALTQDCWKAVKGDPATTGIKVIGPAMAISDALPAGSFFQWVDYGAFHPYPYGGNTWSNPVPYASVSKYFWSTDQPSVNIDEYPYAFQRWAKAFSNGSQTKPMVATETGYFTGNSTDSVTETVQAKYVPRLAAEYFSHAVARTFFYELVDEGTNLSNRENNFGLIHHDLSPKPAYIALASLLGLLQDSSGRKAPGPSSLSLSISVQPSGAYTRTQYVHDLLLEKSDGHFFLLLWHEVSDAALADDSGNPIHGTARELNPPALPTTVTLPQSIAQANTYRYDSSWRLREAPAHLQNSQISLAVGDTITVLELIPRY